MDEKEKPETTTEQAKPKEEAEVGLSDRVAKMQAERLAAKEAELERLEEKVDKKIQELKSFVEKTETQGRGLAGSAVQETDEDVKKKQADDEVRRLLQGTGLEKRVLG